MDDLLKFIEMPNLPQSPVRLAVVDGRIPVSAVASLESLGIGLIKTEQHPDLYDAIAYHPDIFLHHTGGNRIIYAPNTPTSLLLQLSKHGLDLTMGETVLSRKYPADIAYNAARVGRFYFHNLKYTDPVLRMTFDRLGLEPIDIRQGYAKCSISVVDEYSIITADMGIAKAAEKKGLEVLLIGAVQGIQLQGLDYGFIGGSSGLLDKRIWAVCGDACQLASYTDVSHFLNKKNIEIVSLSDSLVTDIGSILPLKQDPIIAKE